MDKDNENFSRNFRQAPIWQLIDQGAGRFVRIAASVILARLLFPDDFGIYALSLSILELSRLSVNLGIGSAIVQTADSPDEFSNSAFWVNLTASFLMFVNTIVFSFIGAKFLDESVLIYTAPVLGVTLLTGGFIHINQSLLIRNLEFKTIAKASVTKLAVESVSSIILALTGFGIWAFILGYVCGDLFQSIIIWFSTTWRPKLKPDFNYPKKFWKFGAQIFLFCLSTYLLDYLPNFIVGHIAGAYILGFFSFAWRQSKWIGDIPMLVGKNMLFPAFSRLQSSPQEFSKLYDRWLRFMLVWCAPIFILQFVFAPLYVPFIFGAKWLPAVAALQMLVLMTFFEITFYVPHSEGVTACGKVEKNVSWRIIEAVALAITLVFVAEHGVTAIALGILTVRVGIKPFYLFWTRSVVHVKFKSLIQSVFPAVLLCCSAWFVGIMLYRFSSHFTQLALLSMVLLSVGCWFYFGMRIMPEIMKLVAEAMKMFTGRFKPQIEPIVSTSE